jgi:hypothetical protein
MKLNAAPAFVALLSMLLVSCSGEAPPQAIDPNASPLANEAAALAADRSWMAALAGNDTGTAGQLLDTAFHWIDADGRVWSRAEALAGAVDLADDLRAEVPVQTYHYGHVEVVTGERLGQRAMRVWALQPEGWRVLIVIATPVTSGTTPFAATGAAASGDCDNPCRSMPYKATTENEQIIADIFMQLKMDEWHPNAERWAPYVLDNVFYTTATAHLSKAARVEHLAALERSGETSVPGDPVVSMRIFDFGDSAVMVAQHNPYRGGQPYLSVRVWALRDGRWQLANTQQTEIFNAAAVPAANSR